MKIKEIEVNGERVTLMKIVCLYCSREYWRLDKGQKDLYCSRCKRTFGVNKAKEIFSPEENFLPKGKAV